MGTARWIRTSPAAWVLAVGLAAAVGLGGLPGAAAAAADGVPAGASARTKAAVQTTEQRLLELEQAVAQTAADYQAAKARLSQARQGVVAGDREADLAEAATVQATVQVGQYAANAYMRGPIAGTAAVLNSASASDMLHVAGMLDVVGDNQVGAVARLERGRTAALAARERARVGRAAAAAAEADATRLAATAKVQMAETVTLLEQLHARADREAVQATAARAAEAERLALARLSAASATGGLADLPPGALSTGPALGLPEEAGPDPGDGQPGGDHLRPRAERARWLVTALFGITDIGGWRPSDAISGDHPSGRAIDVMMTTIGTLPDSTRAALGWRIARWAQANAAGLGVTYVIWQGRIWSVARNPEGWRDYTANFPYGSNVNPTTLHMDHVHISFG